MGLTKNSVKSRVKEHGGYEVNDGVVTKKQGVRKTEN